MLPSLTNLFKSGNKAEAQQSAVANPLNPEEAAKVDAEVHTMPNGLIQDKQVQYTLVHFFDGSSLKLALNAGPGHTSVTAFPANHDPAAVSMKNDGDIWTAELEGFKDGEEVEVHFVIENNGHQVDNSTAKHKLSLKSTGQAASGPEKHKMPNGHIDDKKVEYTLNHTFNGELLSLKLDAGSEHTSVTAYPSPHDPAAVAMTKEGDVWTAHLKGFKEGDELEVHFVIEKNGQQADNSSARHKIAVPPAAA